MIETTESTFSDHKSQCNATRNHLQKTKKNFEAYRCMEIKQHTPK